MKITFWHEAVGLRKPHLLFVGRNLKQSHQQKNFSRSANPFTTALAVIKARLQILDSIVRERTFEFEDQPVEVLLTRRAHGFDVGILARRLLITRERFDRPRVQLTNVPELSSSCRTGCEYEQRRN